MSFLSVPAKKSYEIDIATPIQRWIASTFSSADNPESSNAPQEFQKLRNNAVCKPLDRHESSLEILYRYYDQLVAVEAKLPFSATQIIIPFRWKDAFDKGSLFTKSALSLSSGGYEKASTLFNIAALQSQVAAAQTLESDTEVKLCAKLFQQSAGIFNYLKESVMGLIGQEATPDLMPDTLAALSTLMIAQGQEAIYLKAARDKMKPLVVSKIANQAAEFYAEAQKQMGRDLVRSLWDREWLAAVGGKQLGFQALAHYYQALVSKEASEIGPELAHLTKAKELISGASCAKLFPEDVNKVTRAYEAAKKDNDFIYHERIPDVKTLPAIGKAALSKALPITTPMGPGFRDLFSHLVPVVVQQALAAYDTRKAAIINGETARIREATQIMNGILASLNLPAAVEDACNADVLPASLKDKSNAMRSDGGLQKIKALIDDLPSLLQRNREILDETSRLITEEKASDDQLRSQFKEKWTRMASERLTEPLWAEIGKYKTILDTATGADQIVKQKFDAKRKGIELLSQPESDLRAAIPSLVGTGTGNTTAVVRLKQVLARVDAVKAERQTLEEELKDVGSKFNMSDVFLRALADSGALNEQDVSTDKLNEIYTPIRERISASIQVQEQLMREIQESNTSFVQERGTGGGEREKFLKELASAYDSYSELKANLQEGTKFYNDLTPLLVRLQQKVSDFCFARKTEKEELLKDLSQSIVGQVSPEAPPQPQHFQTAAKVPPGRPPPPRPVAPVQQHSAPPAHQQEFIPPPANAPVYHQAPPCQQQQQQGGYGGQVPPQPYANYGGMPQYPTYPGAYQQQPQQPYPTNPYPYGGPMPPQQNPYAPYQPYPQQPGNQPAYPNQPQPPYPQNPQWR